MVPYTKPLPRLSEITQVARQTAFPATRQEIAEPAGGDLSMPLKNFLKLFPANETFDSRSDFTTRCQELELLITEERDMPEETLRSPQD
jgi:hypothetical protein